MFIILGVLIAPFVMVMLYNIAVIFVSMLLVVYADALSIMGYDGMRKWVDNNL